MDCEIRANYQKVNDEKFVAQSQKEGDNQNLLPTDDQLECFVDTLCDNFPILHVEDNSQNCETADENSSARIDNSSSVNDFLMGNKLALKNEKHKPVLVNFSSANPKASSEDKFKGVNEGRSFCYNSLNLAILQCTGSLDSLIQKRKSLELLVQIHRKVLNINYNFSYIPRLPDSPTRVDRLIFDVNQERCRILGLMSALEDTISSFSSKLTKDELRKLLVTYAQVIVSVIKERQCEINSDVSEHNSGVLKLVKLINEVHRMNRLVHTALWCIEVKEQMGVVMLRRNFQKTPKTFEEPQEIGMMPQKWHAMKFVQEKQSIFPRESRVANITDSQYFQRRTVRQYQSNTQFSSSARRTTMTLWQSQYHQKRDEKFQLFL